MNKDKNIGFVGLGNVGIKLANSILIGKYNLFIHDLNLNKGKNLIKKGAIWCSSIKELCHNTTIIFTCLPSLNSVSQVIEGAEGISNYINKNHLWIEMSTTDEKEMIRLASILILKGANVLEAPVTGGQHKAESGNISILVGGCRKNFERAFPILSQIGYKILFCGKLGNASTLKVVTNFLASINLISLGESLMVCKKYGIDLTTAYHGIKISSGNSFVHETESQVILNGSYDVGFTMDLVCKDLSLYNNIINKFNIPSKLSKLILQIFNEGKNEFGNRSLSTSIIKKIENLSLDNLRSPHFPSKLIDKDPRKKGFEIKF